MSKVLVLGSTGSGKTTSLFEDKEFGIKGLIPKETFIISAGMKALPLKNWKSIYPPIKEGEPPIKGNYCATNNGLMVAKIINSLAERKDIENIVLDDNQYLMGDYYMENSSKGDAFSVFKKIGSFMSNIVTAINVAHNNGKMVVVLSHYELAGTEDTELIFKPKTAGKMVDNYLTLEGKFDLVLFAFAKANPIKKTADRFFVTNADGVYNQARSPHHMFDSTHIINDMGLVKEKIKLFNQSI